MDQQTLTVSQLTHAIKMCLESTFPLIRLQGEVSNFKQQTSGHLYFSLKDAAAQIGAIMFKGDAQFLPKLPKEGDNVIVKGELSLYPQTGKYQIIIRELQYAGLGELLLRLEEMKQKVHKMGWFRREHKKPLPKFPKKIGVVTSPTGAVIKDIINVLSRRFSGFHLILNPVKVQGEGAAQEIAQAIRQFNEHQLVDVMIVGRGGGSIEDLWAFNELIVAEAIFQSKIPIIAAVGHETDHCIAEYVADIRAPTPSAAAEIVIGEKAQQLQHLEQIKRRAGQAITHLIKQDRRRLEYILKQPALSSPYYLLGSWMQQMDLYKDQIELAQTRILQQKRLMLEEKRKQVQALKPDVQIANYKVRFCQLREQIDAAWKNRQEFRRRLFNTEAFFKMIDLYWQKIFLLKKERLENIQETLLAYNPKNILSKGYTIIFSEKSGSVINSVCHLKKDDNIRLLLADGEAITTVKEVLKSGK